MRPFAPFPCAAVTWTDAHLSCPLALSPLRIQLLQSSPAVPPSEPGAPSSLFDAPEHAGGPAAPALGGVDRLVAYLNAKTGLVGEVDDEEGGAAAGGGWDGDGWFDNDG